jgi:hypothetical protein
MKTKTDAGGKRQQTLLSRCTQGQNKNPERGKAGPEAIAEGSVFVLMKNRLA